MMMASTRPTGTSIECDTKALPPRNSTTTFLISLSLTTTTPIILDVEEKVKEEYKKDNQIDQREWYQEGDDSHLKNQVKANAKK